MSLPKGWSEFRLKDITKRTQLGGNYENAESNFGTPLIKMGNLARGRISTEKVQSLPQGITPNEKDILREGDLLFNTRNTLELVGKVSIWRNELPRAAFDLNLMRIEFDNNIIHSTEYMNAWFNSGDTLRNLRKLAIGTTSVAAIYQSDLETLKIRLPPLEEQKKIAEILSTWDRAIEEITREIARAEIRHKGIAQRVFGRSVFNRFQRNPYSNIVRLGELFDERTEIGNTHLPLLAVTGTEGVVPRDQLSKRDTSNPDKGKYLRVCPGDIAYNTMRMWQGVCGLSKLEGLVSPAYTVLQPKPGINADFFYHLFKFRPMIHTFWRNSQGLVDDTLNLKYEQFGRIRVALPSSRVQDSVAALLNLSDANLLRFKAHLQSVQKQKQGLMQKLLTGKVRVKV